MTVTVVVLSSPEPWEYVMMTVSVFVIVTTDTKGHVVLLGVGEVLG